MKEESNIEYSFDTTVIVRWYLLLLKSKVKKPPCFTSQVTVKCRFIT